MRAIIVQGFCPIQWVGGQDTTWNRPIPPKSQAAKKTDCLSVATDVFIYKVVKMMESEITSKLANTQDKSNWWVTNTP